MYVFAVTQLLFLGAVLLPLPFAELVQGRPRHVSDSCADTEVIWSFPVTVAEEAIQSLFLGNVLLPLHFAGLVQGRLCPVAETFSGTERIRSFPLTALED